MAVSYDRLDSSPKLGPQLARIGCSCTQLVLLIAALELIILPAWLAVVTQATSTARTDAQQALTAISSGGAGGSASLLIPACDGCIQPGWAVSFDSAMNGKLRAGAGTSAYVGAQRISTPGMIPAHTGLVAISNDTVLLGLGGTATIGYLPSGATDWVTGQSVSIGGDAASNGVDGGAVWLHNPVSLPIYPDDILLLSATARTVLLVGGGSAVVGIIVPADGTGAPPGLTFGPVAQFYSGVSVDTDTTVLSESSFAVSYYTTSDAGDMILTTVLGTVDSSNFVISFSQSVDYSPDHVTHGLTGLIAPSQASADASAAWVLAYPCDNLTTGEDPMVQTDGGVPMGIVVASASSGTITIWGQDGPSSPGSIASPWTFNGVRAYYFFDAVTLAVDPQPLNGGVAATIALAFPDADAAWAIRVLTAQLWLTTDGAGSVTGVDLLWGDLVAATPAGASQGYKYFQAQPLFTVPPVFAMRSANDELKREVPARLLRSLGTTSGHSTAGSAASSALSSSAREFALVYADVSAGGAVQATVVSYDTASQALRVAVPEMLLSPPYPELDPTDSDDYFWVSAGTIPPPAVLATGGVTPLSRLLIFTSLKAPGETSGACNLTLLERTRSSAIGIAGVSDQNGAISVSVSGIIGVQQNALVNSTSGHLEAGTPVFATSRGPLLASPLVGGIAQGLWPADNGPVTVVVSGDRDGCVGVYGPANARNGDFASVLMGGERCTT